MEKFLATQALTTPCVWLRISIGKQEMSQLQGDLQLHGQLSTESGVNAFLIRSVEL